MDINPNPIRR